MGRDQLCGRAQGGEFLGGRPDELRCGAHLGHALLERSDPVQCRGVLVRQLLLSLGRLSALLLELGALVGERDDGLLRPGVDIRQLVDSTFGRFR